VCRLPIRRIYLAPALHDGRECRFGVGFQRQNCNNNRVLKAASNLLLAVSDTLAGIREKTASSERTSEMSCVFVDLRERGKYLWVKGIGDEMFKREVKGRWSECRITL